MKYFQQGDVLIKPFNSLPNWRQESLLHHVQKGDEINELILAEGETTGHAHRLRGKITKFVPKDARVRTETIIFELTEDAVLSHEEHASFTLPAGTYYIEQVREFDHFAGRSTFVAD